MSKKLKKNSKDFNYQVQNLLPKRPVIKTEWALKDLYYKSEKDPKIESDLKKTETSYQNFVKKWQKKDFIASPKILAAALRDYEILAEMPESSRPQRYFGFRSVLNANDHVAEKQSALISQRLKKISNQMLFFTLTIGKVPKAKQKTFLSDESLKPYRYFLERTFLLASHNLTEPEEKILNLKSSQSYGDWVKMLEKIISNRKLSFKGKDLPINEALETIDVLNSADKKKLWSLIIAEMKQIGEVAEHEFNAIITDARVDDELRGYKKPYSGTALSYQDTEKSIENLIAVVSDKGFKLSQKFYKLKAQYHGQKTLHYTEKYLSIGKPVVIDFNQSVDICRDVFYGINNIYGEIFDNMLKNGQIDVYPKAGKRGGAFMSEEVGHPTHVFLNHLNNFKSLETLAHEMGHAIHAERSKTQPVFYQGHSITTAETASTLFENLLFDAVFLQAKVDEKPILLHDRLTRDIATIQRQIAFFNCELEIHETIRAQGAMSNEELRDTMFKHLKSYLGPAIELTKDDGYSYVYIPHLRYGFYVYTYTFGMLMSTIMANHYKADKTYATSIDKFLTAGESATVSDIFASIGINTTKADVFSEALKTHETDINVFSKLVKKKVG